MDWLIWLWSLLPRVGNTSALAAAAGAEVLVAALDKARRERRTTAAAHKVRWVEAEPGTRLDARARDGLVAEGAVRAKEALVARAAQRSPKARHVSPCAGEQSCGGD